MKCVRNIQRVSAILGLLVLFIITQLGCASTDKPPTPKSDINNGAVNSTFRPGDKVVIDFADTPGMPSSWPQQVREDGTITLPYNQSFVIAGKRKGEIELEIHRLYVPKILRRLTVNVRAEERTYFVSGEVRTPGQRPHTGSITALKAVSAAGDFTDFANKKKIDVIRATGEKVTLNGADALIDSAKDIPVYPGDTVFVHRRLW